MSMILEFLAKRIEIESMGKLGPDGDLRIHAIITIEDPRDILNAIEEETGGRKAIQEWLKD